MRCGFYYKMSALELQYQWAGPSLVSLGIYVCRRTCLDVPQEQLRTIIIGPDPTPVIPSSPTFYAQQNLGGVAGPLDAANAPLFDED